MKTINIHLNIHLLALLILSFSSSVIGQCFPFEIVFNKVEYRYNDSLDVTIINKSDKNYYVGVGLEKLNQYGIWEEVTGSILYSESAINGKAKGGLLYSLQSFDSIKINRVISQINLPFLVLQGTTELDSMKKYRISVNNSTEHNEVFSGNFRISIKFKVDKDYIEDVMIKTQNFTIN